LTDEDQERIISYETIDTILARLDETLIEVAEEFGAK
jgi:hypothetical protein